MTIGKVHVTKSYVRKRLESPAKFDPRSFRTKEVKRGVKVIVACPKGQYSPKMQMCKKGFQAQAILKRRRK